MRCSAAFIHCVGHGNFKFRPPFITIHHHTPPYTTIHHTTMSLLPLLPMTDEPPPGTASYFALQFNPIFSDPTRLFTTGKGCALCLFESCPQGCIIMQACSAASCCRYRRHFCRKYTARVHNAMKYPLCPPVPTTLQN